MLKYVLRSNPKGHGQLQLGIAVTRKIFYNTDLDEVEFLHDGQAEQHKEQAAEVQQQARLPNERIAPMTKPKKVQNT